MFSEIRQWSAQQVSARVLVGAVGALLAAASGCHYSHGGEPSPCNNPTPVTYAAVVSPIFDAHCRQCHGSAVYSTLGGGNDYSSYQGIKKQSAVLLMGSVRHSPGFDPMPKGQAQLSPCEIAQLQTWIDAGQPNN